MLANKNEYRQRWKESSANIEKLFRTFDGGHKKNKEEILKTYDLYVKKLLSIFGISPSNDHMTVDDFLGNSCVQFSADTGFKGVFVDFEYMNLNGKLLNSYDRSFYPLSTFDSLRTGLPSGDLQQFDTVVLLLNKENAETVESQALGKITQFIKQAANKRTQMRYFFLYLTLYLTQKEEPVIFKPFTVELIESAIEEYLPMVFTGAAIDYETLLYILYICYEVSNNCFISGQKGFSSLFLAFLKNLNCWYKIDCWQVFVENLSKFLENPYLSFYYLDRQTWLSAGKRTSAAYIRDIYQYLMLIGCHFLALPFNLFMDIINAINASREDIGLNYIVDLTKTVESYLIGNDNAIESQRVHFLVKHTRLEKLCLALKCALPWLERGDNSYLSLMTASSSVYLKLRRKLAKHHLRFDLSRECRISVWAVICNPDRSTAKQPAFNNGVANGSSHNSQQHTKFTSSRHLLNRELTAKGTTHRDGSVTPKDNDDGLDYMLSEDDLDSSYADENFALLINLDVKRTNFVKEHKKSLKKLLVTLARRYPTLMYYQGMNCIGGFLLKYTWNYSLSLAVFSYMIETQLAESFQKSFIELSKLIFVSEKLLEKYNPVLFGKLQKFTNSADFYLSPLILTIFSSAMQTIDASDFVAVVFDYFLKEKWLGLFKVITVLFGELESPLLSLSTDDLAVFLKKGLFEHFLTIDLAKFKQKLASSPIRKKDVRSIEIEYNTSRRIVETYWKEFYEMKKLKRLN